MCLNFQRLFMHKNFQYRYSNFHADFVCSDYSCRLFDYYRWAFKYQENVVPLIKFIIRSTLHKVIANLSNYNLFLTFSDETNEIKIFPSLRKNPWLPRLPSRVANLQILLQYLVECVCTRKKISALGELSWCGTLNFLPHSSNLRYTIHLIFRSVRRAHHLSCHVLCRKCIYLYYNIFFPCTFYLDFIQQVDVPHFVRLRKYPKRWLSGLFSTRSWLIMFSPRTCSIVSCFPLRLN